MATRRMISSFYGKTKILFKWAPSSCLDSHLEPLERVTAHRRPQQVNRQLSHADKFAASVVLHMWWFFAPLSLSLFRKCEEWVSVWVESGKAPHLNLKLPSTERRGRMSSAYKQSFRKTIVPSVLQFRQKGVPIRIQLRRQRREEEREKERKQAAAAFRFPSLVSAFLSPSFAFSLSFFFFYSVRKHFSSRLQFSRFLQQNLPIQWPLIPICSYSQKSLFPPANNYPTSSHFSPFCLLLMLKVHQ